jgi:phage-related protein
VPTHISIGTAIDKSRLASNVTYIDLLEVDIMNRTNWTVIDTLRFAHNSENYVFRGQTYVRASFTFDISRGKGELPQITIEVVDVAQVLQAMLQEHQGGTDFPMRLLMVASTNTAAPELEERFTILSARASSDHHIVSLELGAENPLLLRFPTRLTSRRRCTFSYRDADCGYTGPMPSCDYSRDGPNGCKAHNNIANFGGFSGIRRVGA